MKLQKVIEVLKYHNKWREGTEIEMTDPKELSEAIDVAVHLLGSFKK